MKKEYRIHLKFDVWSCQSWFIGEDSPEAEAKWEQARLALPQIAEGCSNPQQFSQRAADHFRTYGFERVHK